VIIKAGSAVCPSIATDRISKYDDLWQGSEHHEASTQEMFGHGSAPADDVPMQTTPMSDGHPSDDEETAACRVTHDIMVKHRLELPGIIARLVSSSRRPELLAHVDAELIPSSERAVEVNQRARCLLFPGSFGGQVLDFSGLEYAVGMEVIQLFEDLSQLISLSIRHDCQRYQMVCTHCQERGQEEAVAFLNTLPEIREVLATDIQAAYDGEPAARTLDEVVISYPGALAVTIHRVAHQLW
jgi:serine O-acetyltransferase